VDVPHAMLIVLTVAVVVVLAFLRRRSGATDGGSLKWTFRIGKKPRINFQGLGKPGVGAGEGEGLPQSSTHYLLDQVRTSGSTISRVVVREGVVSPQADLRPVPDKLQKEALEVSGDSAHVTTVRLPGLLGVFAPRLAGAVKNIGEVQELLSRGDALRRENKLDEAVTTFGKAVFLARHNLNSPDCKTGAEEMIAGLAHHSLGETLVAQGDLGRAVVELREGVRLAPKLAALHEGLGNALDAIGENEGASAEFREALRLDPNLASIYTNSGDKLAGEGSLDLAISAYHRALRLNPDLQQAQQGLQAALQKKGTSPKTS
jgi:tetratricopeptide repeat protein